MNTEILLDMLFEFLSKRRVTAHYLAEKYNVSERTVYRYVEALSHIYCHLKSNITFSKKLMIIGGILTLLITAVSLISPYLYKILVDDVMTAGKIDLIYYVIPAMVGVYLIKVVLSGIRTYVNKKFSYRTTLQTKSRLMQKFLDRDISAATGKEIGKQSNNN